MNVRLIIPHSNVWQPYPYCKRIAGITGGFTAFNATGGWIDLNNKLITEQVTVVDTSIGGDDVNTINQLRHIAKAVCNDLNQDCVFLSFDGETHYVLKDGSDMTPA